MKVEDTLRKIVAFFGKGALYFVILLALLIFLNIISRYLFDYTFIWVVELELYFFALIFLLGGAYTFQVDKHVRVDVFYEKFSDKNKARVNFLGGILFLLPWSAFMMWHCLDYFWVSYLINESSLQPGGLPGLYILKFFLFFSFSLLFIQGLLSVSQSYKQMRVVLN